MARPRKEVYYNRRSVNDRRDEYRRVHTLIYDNARKYRKAELVQLGYSNGWQIVKEDIGGLNQAPTSAEIDRLWDYLEDEEWKDIIDRVIEAEEKAAEAKRQKQAADQARRAEWQRKYQELLGLAGKAYDHTAPPGRILVRDGAMTPSDAEAAIPALWADLENMQAQKAGHLFDYIQTRMEQATNEHDDGTEDQYLQVCAIFIENMILESDAYYSWNEYIEGSHEFINGLPPERVVYDARHGVLMGPGKLGTGLDPGRYIADETLRILDKAMELLYFGEDFLTMFWRHNPITSAGSINQNWGWIP